MISPGDRNTHFTYEGVSDHIHYGQTDRKTSSGRRFSVGNPAISEQYRRQISPDS
jgi:hypothetical protein